MSEDEIVVNAKFIYSYKPKSIEYKYAEFLDPNFDASISFGGIEIFSVNFPESIPNLEFRILDTIYSDIFSSKYFGRLVTVWYNSYPLAIIQQNGKWGCGFNKMFITSQSHYKQMLMGIFNAAIIKELDNPKDSIVIKDYDPRQDLINFDNLYFDTIKCELKQK